MSSPGPTIQLPTPRSAAEVPTPIPEYANPGPSIVAVLGQRPEETAELAIVAKRTLWLRDDGVTEPAEIQVPLSDEYAPHPPLADGSKGSPMLVPEALGYRSGTDLIIRAHARPGRSVREAYVSVAVERYIHRAVVYGDRHAELVRGRIRFSDPAPFEAMPLRYELAYGGQDDLLRVERLRAVRSALSVDDWRTSAAFLKDSTDGMPGISYPRNRFGRGYVVLDDPRQFSGLRLPNIELPDDLLTPERLIVGVRENWHRQPVPAGFDFLEPAAFPRTAMVGMPPTTFDFDSAAEVRRGQVPRGYCRGNAMNTTPSEIEKLVNLEFVRCAPIGLRFGFLRLGETVVLSGMRPDRPEWAVRIPDRPPEFTLEYQKQLLRLSGELHQVFVDVDARCMELVWVARTPVRRAPAADEVHDLARRTGINWCEARA